MKIYHHNQYDVLKSCLLCYPVNFKINDKSSEYYNKIDYDLLYRQYNNYVNELSNNNVKINFIDLNKNAYNQIFTQDIGFVIEDILFISKMRKEERKIETKYIKEFTDRHDLKFYEMHNNIEGGDVIHHNDVVFAGISTRTTISAAKELQEALREFNINSKVVPVHFDKEKLHLDCVFNVLSEDECVICPYIINDNEIKSYIKNAYEISKTDADMLGTNFVNLGNKVILSSNKNVTYMLRDKGYDVRFIDYSEIMKNEGSLGCSILYLERGK